MEQHRIRANGLNFNVWRAGSGGQPLLLLHGWPEFAAVWHKVMDRLADRFTLIAPDLRGFGDSDKPDPGPSDKAGADVHAADMLAVLETLGIGKCGIVAHDVGAYVSQSIARSHPESVAGLFYFDCPYPGIGARGAAPDHLKEIWYQYFHQQPWAAEMVGASRETCRLYFSHFLSHWSARKDAFDNDIEAWVDNFLKPGNMQGGFNWYISNNASRLAMLRGDAPAPTPITVPTCCRWGEAGSVLPSAWGDRMGEFFTNVDFKPLPGVGHFPHWEDPDLASAEIAKFFGKLADEAWKS